MNSNAKFLSSLRWSLRCAEWLLLLMIVLTYAFSPYSSVALMVKAIASCLLFFLLSFIFPINRPLWQRRAYVALELLLIVISIAAGIELSFILFLLLVKSCFLLSRREAVITILVGGIGCLASVAWSYPSLVERSRAIEEFSGLLTSELHKTLIYALIQYTSFGGFALLLGFLVIAERQSREKAEALSQEVETLATSLERLRIAREIHDSLGHTLTSLGVQLEVAQKLRPHDLEKSFRSVDNAALIAAQCLQEVRQLVSTMRQSNFNLTEALQDTIELLRQQAITISVNLSLPSLPLQTSHQLYCILKEGLINIQKHSQASQVKLNGFAIADKIMIILQDNGQGFDSEKRLVGYGLRGMQERVELLQGTMSVNSFPHQGTQIEVVIPYDSSTYR